MEHPKKIRSFDSVVTSQHKARPCTNHPAKAGFIGGLCGACYHEKLVREGRMADNNNMPTVRTAKDAPVVIPTKPCAKGHIYTEQNVSYYRLRDGRWRLKCLDCAELYKKQCSNGHIRTADNHYEYEHVDKTTGLYSKVLICKLCHKEAGLRRKQRRQGKEN